MNKHKMIAVLIAPVLALGVYILADVYMDKEETTNDKKLVVTGQCRPINNQCEILGTDMKIRLVFMAEPSYQRLLPISLRSKTSLDNVAMSLIIDGEKIPPVKMKDVGDKKHWQASLLPFANVTKDNVEVRLAISYKAALHVAEFPIVY